MRLVLIGHAGHPEVEGTMGQLPEGAITLVETVEDVENFIAQGPRPAWPISPRPPCRSTTPPRWSSVLRRRFPDIAGPHKEDICYATTNRQEAMKAIAPRADVVFVVGRAQFVQFDAPGRSCQAGRRQEGHADPARQRHRLVAWSTMPR